MCILIRDSVKKSFLNILEIDMEGLEWIQMTATKVFEELMVKKKTPTCCDHV